ncbi:aconitase X swivel domain-containing protein [Chthonobacter rhizosphaerae]|uniref:aconitase X swivel domain-containing protein n=1 Tax=Chthonobacter rhizosphaerae TaxID=2735553 RepID=UPI0015EF705E|nr:DUF126 domain-containing protein [Chthonobacter rhizosphaerae]
MTATARPADAITLVPGEAEGPVLVLSEPLSFWGGFDAATGLIIDRWHPQHGASLAGQVLVMDAGRGSSSGSSVLAEALRRGTGPAAIVLATRDAIVTVGAMVAVELYGIACPVVLAGPADWRRVAGAICLAVRAAPAGATLHIA